MPPVPGWHPVPAPGRQKILKGIGAGWNPCGPDHAPDLYAGQRKRIREGAIWTYLPYGPYAGMRPPLPTGWHRSCGGQDPFFYAIIDKAKRTRLSALPAICAINPEMGSIEVGHINYSPLLQRTAAATEAMYLMMRNAFGMGYRRYEWKCNALNEKSCRAAVTARFLSRRHPPPGRGL